MVARLPSPALTVTRRRLPRLGIGAVLTGALFGLAACAIDPARLPKTYLLQAQQAVQAHDAPAAVAALDHAQALWLSANSPFSTPFFGFDPEALRNMGNARVAVQMGRWNDAAYYVRTAIAQPSVVNPGYLQSPGP